MLVKDFMVTEDNLVVALGTDSITGTFTFLFLRRILLIHLKFSCVFAVNLLSIPSPILTPSFFLS